MQITFANPNVSTTFEQYPPETRERLLKLRQLIFDVAAENDNIGELEETLKWGQMSYLTPQTKSGSTVRMDAWGDDPGAVALFFICHTHLVDRFRSMYGSELNFDGERAIWFGAEDDIPEEAVKHCIELALTYHLWK